MTIHIGLCLPQAIFLRVFIVHRNIKCNSKRNKNSFNVYFSFSNALLTRRAVAMDGNDLHDKSVCIAASVDDQVLTHVHQTVLPSPQEKFQRPESGWTVAEYKNVIDSLAVTFGRQSELQQIKSKISAQCRNSPALARQEGYS